MHGWINYPLEHIHGSHILGFNSSFEWGNGRVTVAYIGVRFGEFCELGSGVTLLVKVIRSDQTEAPVSDLTGSLNTTPLEDIWLDKLQNNWCQSFEDRYRLTNAYANTEILNGLLSFAKLREFLPYVVPEAVTPKPIFRKVLSDLLRERPVRLDFKTVNGIPSLTRGLDYFEPLRFHHFQPSMAGMAEILTTEILVLEYASSGGIFEPWICKARLPKDLGLAVCQVVDTDDDPRKLHQINLAFKDDPKPIRVPSLLGYIKDPFEDKIIGYARQWIYSLEDLSPGRHNTSDDGTLFWVGVNLSKISIERRTKWAEQVEDMVLRLHNIGLVWNCDSPGGIAIDVNDDAWITRFDDFAGSGDWVDRDVLGTRAGDLQAIQGLYQYLGVPRD